MTTADKSYDLVEKYFEEDGSQCAECPFYKEWKESRGEFWGTPSFETMCECQLLESGETDKCPALSEIIATDD